MIAIFEKDKKRYKVDLSKPIDISIAVRSSKDNVSAWYVQPPLFEPVKMGNWVGDVKQGGAVNFRDIFFNPHGHGTHTECVGHISKEDFSINTCLKTFFFTAELITISPEKNANDWVITKTQVEAKLKNVKCEALIIRTLPNTIEKTKMQYSNTNPPYIHYEAIAFLTEHGVNHFLIDLPSVDKEEDGGTLLAHHAFWQYPHNTQAHRTITELVYVPNEVADGSYILNLQIASFENDASPSKPVLYTIQ